MINESDKYRAEMFKISGFSCIVPFGRIFFEPIAFFKECGSIPFFCYVIVAFGLAVLGLVFVLKGYDILSLEEKK